MPSIIISIDPGITGALAANYLKTGEVKVFDLPQEAAKKPKFLDEIELYAMVENLLEGVSGEEKVLFALENVHASNNQGSSSAFNFGHNYAICKTVLSLIAEEHNTELKLITPQKWKAIIGLPGGKNKKLSLKLAREMFPSIAKTDLRLAGHSDRAEALLIGVAHLKLDELDKRLKR